MPTRKRASSRSRLGRAVKAGRSAIKEAQKHVPPELRRQIDRSIKDGQKRFDATVKDIRARVNKAAKQADLNSALKRLDGLSKQVQQLARSVTSRAASGTRSTRATATRRATTARRAVTRKAAATKRTATRKAAARKPAAPKRATAPAKRASTTRTRRAAAMPEPTIRYVPPAIPEAPGPMPIEVETP
jgi:hypothetical protein